MFLLTFFFVNAIDAACLLSVNTVSGTFGSACTNLTVANGVYTPSSECGYNYVCNTDNNFCTSSYVCTTIAGSANLQNAAGLPCKVDGDCGGNGYFCAQLSDSTTQTQMASYWYFSSGQFTGGVQATFASAGIYSNTASSTMVNTTGVCVCAPPSNLAGHSYNYASNPKCCGTHTDCKFAMYLGATKTGGNNYGNYMCSNSGGNMCRQTASCHPVSHQCEAPLDTPTSGYTYFNPSCTSCATSVCGNNASSWSCGITSNACCTQEPTCKTGGLYYPNC